MVQIHYSAAVMCQAYKGYNIYSHAIYAYTQFTRVFPFRARFDPTQGNIHAHLLLPLLPEYLLRQLSRRCSVICQITDKELYFHKCRPPSTSHVYPLMEA